MQLCCVTLDVVVRLAGCGNPELQPCLPVGEKKGFQDSPDSPLCGLPIGILIPPPPFICCFSCLKITRIMS